MPPSPVPVPGLFGDRSGAVALWLLHAAMSAPARVAVLTPRPDVRVDLFVAVSLGPAWGLVARGAEPGYLLREDLSRGITQLRFVVLEVYPFLHRHERCGGRRRLVERITQRAIADFQGAKATRLVRADRVLTHRHDRGPLLDSRNRANARKRTAIGSDADAQAGVRVLLVHHVGHQAVDAQCERVGE